MVFNVNTGPFPCSLVSYVITFVMPRDRKPKPRSGSTYDSLSCGRHRSQDSCL